MAYTLSELSQRVGLEVPPARDELLRWHKTDDADSVAEVYLSEDGRFFSIEVENNGPGDPFFAPAHVKHLYLQAQKIPGTSGFEVTELNVDGYSDFDFNDSITGDFGLSIAFVSIDDIKKHAIAEAVGNISSTFVSNAGETTGNKGKIRTLDMHQEGNVIHVANWPKMRA